MKEKKPPRTTTSPTFQLAKPQTSWVEKIKWQDFMLPQCEKLEIRLITLVSG